MKIFSSFLVVLFFLTITSQARNIYVAKSGNDNNPGTQASPYLTISKAASVAVAGDVVIIGEGTYEELLNPANSGTAGNPITFKGKDGEKVIITAMQAVNNWSLDNGNIYKASVNWDLGQDNMALHKDQLMDLARWPNNQTQNLFERDYLPGCNKGSAGGNTTTMNYNGSEGNGHGNTIPHAGKWENGGSLHFYGGAGFLAWTEYVTSSTVNQIKFNLKRNQNWITDKHNPGYTGHGVKKGEFFLQGIKEALDYKNEWWLDKNTKTLYVQIEGGGMPENNTLRFRRRTQAILINKNFIRVENLAVFGGSIDINGNDNTLHKVSSFYGNHTLNVINGFDSGRQSVLIKGARNTIDQCEIAWGGGNGVYDKGNNNKLLNSYVHDFNYLGNYDCVLNTRGAVGGIYKNNTLTRAGKDVIQAYVDGGEYAYNDISRSMQIADDGGLLYTTNVRAQKSSIHHNWFHYADAREGRFKAAGIYLDNDSKNWDVHHNVVWNTEWTNIQINWNGINLNIFNNTFVKGSATMGAWHKAGTAFSNVKVWNNLTDVAATDAGGNQETETTWEEQADKQNNLISKTSFVNYNANNYRLKAGAEAIDYGRVISGYTDGFTGAKPDAGAYEYGATWEAGVNWNITAGPNNTCYGLPGEVCSGSEEPVESISLNNTPRNIEQAQNIEVEVAYVANENRDIVAILTAPDGTWLGNGRKTVAKGSGLEMITIELAQMPPVADNYDLAVAIRTVGGNWEDNIDNKSSLVNIVTPLPDADYVEFIGLPTDIVKSNTFDVTVYYEATAQRDISVVFTTPGGQYITNTKQTVEAGTGQITLTINPSQAPEPGEDYGIDATIRTVGGGYADNTYNKKELIDIVVITSMVDNHTSAGGMIYPNPSTGKVYLPQSTEKWTVYSISGEKILETSEKELDMSGYPKGLYLFRSGSKVQKIHLR